MMPATAENRAAVRKSGSLFNRPRLKLILLLGLPAVWFLVIYIYPLLHLLSQSFYTFDDFTMTVVRDFSLENIRNLFSPANADIIIRTATMALAVSVFSAVVAFPVAYYMTRHASGKMQAFLYISVILPMWTSYIVKAYSWTLILSQEGVAYWIIDALGLTSVLHAILDIPSIGGNTLSTSNVGRFLVFTYIWLPFMILPIQAALQRLSTSLLDASNDLGARPFQTFRHVILPLCIPGVIAGSIFTFSLTLGDYIVPQLVGPPGLFIGNMVYVQQGSIGNMPMAAAFTLAPILIIAVYLYFAKRAGAFDAL
ncbi:spermidine/putrescine ABC transporter permease [Marinobacter salinus]|uniref:Spermidine/putrescine ABC transporter permease n=1 Tax=Marinobacter salinus TaxID=1874317 RepID=A0A1D9GNV6_9GAMM|nr:ABC transporter permease [Marinobacter salinus]AOY89318.1 spermidine/putrescine ABC transporter permease [Marinobacter salinus]